MTRSLLLASLIAALCTALSCGRTPLAGAGTDGTSTSSTTTSDATSSSTTRPDPGSETSDTGVDDTGWPGTSDTGVYLDMGAPARTCRDIVMCSLECLTAIDFSCVQMCGEGADPEETQKALALVQCAALSCFESGECGFPPTDPQCLMCLGIKLLAPSPTGCEAEGEACL